MKHFNRDQVLVILFALIVLLSVTAITYAFFTVNVSNDNAQTAEITAGTMALSFSDNDNGINEVLNFGDSVTKKFIIENTGTLDAYAEISWLDLVNTYLKGSLTYTLEYSESTSGPYSKIVNNKNVPTSDIKTTEVLATGISVPAGKKYYYNLIITLNNLPDVDQTADINASFNTRFTLNESDSLSNQTLAVLGLTVNENTPDFSKLSTNIEQEKENITNYCNDQYGNVSDCLSDILPFVSNLEQLFDSQNHKDEIIANTKNYCQQMGIDTDEECLSIFGASSYEDIITTYVDVYDATQEAGLYEMEDDYGTSYYFRGAVENNYVYFAGFYWRIIRINGDGSIRLIYDGTTAHENGYTREYNDRFVGNSPYNTNWNDNAYVGYMYGTVGASSYEETHANINDSTIKTYLDNWYKTNIVDKGYAEVVSDEIFCNDREIDQNAGSLNGQTGYTTLGYGKNNTFYATAARVGIGISNPTPKLTCTQKNDAFTVSDEEKGNGDLTYPVGLITADEIALAGIKFGSMNFSNYLNKNNFYWSASPFNFDDGARVFNVDNVGSLNSTDVDSATDGVAPSYLLRLVNSNVTAYCRLRLAMRGSIYKKNSN